MISLPLLSIGSKSKKVEPKDEIQAKGNEPLNNIRQWQILSKGIFLLRVLFRELCDIPDGKCLVR